MMLSSYARRLPNRLVPKATRRVVSHQRLNQTPHLHNNHLRGPTLYYSTTRLAEQQNIRILYASQTGTAQLFAHQLQEEIEDLELDDLEVSVSPWNEQSPEEVIQNDDFNVFFCSVTGVGDPPENGKEFYDYIMNQTTATTDKGYNDVNYTIFGLGNAKAHPNHYNVIAKRLDKQLDEVLGANRKFPIGLGDDGDCLEDDYDQWLDNFLEFIKKGGETEEAEETLSSGEDAQHVEEAEVEETSSVLAETDDPATTVPISEDRGEDAAALRIASDCSTASDGKRRTSKKYPTLNLQKRQSDICRDDLFHLQTTETNSFYKPKTANLRILNNKVLSPNAGEQALNEMTVSIKDYFLDDGDNTLKYQTGDHFVVYPRNSNCLVDAYCSILDVDPHAIIETESHDNESGGKKYPFPTGLTIYETLSHCIDLGAIPSPSLARQILGRKQLNYKDEIAIPRRTIIDLILEQPQQPNLSLEDLLYQMVPMKPRYYSIASSNKANPDEIRLTFRPVKYMTNRGILREGVATAYLSRKGVVGSGGEDDVGEVAAYVNTNPSFRLPQDPTVPIMMIAGGCGVAPIRAFVEERIAMVQKENISNLGPGTLYLGFRNPQDAVYQQLIETATECGALTSTKVSFDQGCVDPTQECMRVSELVRQEGQKVWNHIDSDGGYIYLCGGARTFGAAIEQEMLEIIKEHGKMSFEEAEQYLRDVMESGRLMEDLAD